MDFNTGIKGEPSERVHESKLQRLQQFQQRSVQQFLQQPTIPDLRASGILADHLRNAMGDGNDGKDQSVFPSYLLRGWNCAQVPAS